MPSEALEEKPETDLKAEQPPEPGEGPAESPPEGGAPAAEAAPPPEAAPPAEVPPSPEAELTPPAVEETRPEIGDTALDAIFRLARTHNKFRETPVTDATLRALYDLLKWGPTSANCSPARFIFVRSSDAKERLRPALSPGNVEKTMAAPVTVIVAYDPKFYDRMNHLFPHEPDAGSWFARNEAFAAETAFRNGTLQGAYLIIAARALGLDCGPMSGFDKAKVDTEFFAYRGWKSNFLCNLGHGDPAGLYARLPRIEFDEACELL